MVTRVISGEGILIVLALLGITAAFYIDLVLLDVPILAEHQPVFSELYVLRTCLIATGCALFIVSVVQFGHAQNNRTASDWTSQWQSWGTLRWYPDDPNGSAFFSVSVMRLVILAIVLLSLGIVLVFLEKLEFFSRMAREDKLVESLSAAIQLLNAGLFAYVGVIIHKNANYRKKISVSLAWAFSFAFFLIAMEEISWFQRILAIESHEIFAENTQGEMNFHNFATDEMENAYYFSMFLLLILAPFLVRCVKTIGNHAVVRVFTPSLFVVYASALFVSYNYEMWNILLTQISFFTTFFILLYYARVARQCGASGLFEFVLLASLVFTQVIFLVSGDRLAHWSDVSEYKEFLIPVACLFYSLDVLYRVSKSTSVPMRWD